MNDTYKQIVKKLGKERAKIDESMVKHTTFKIGGPSDLFYEAKTEKELVEAIKVAMEVGVPYFILGKGSNVLVGDKGIRGMVIKVQSSKFPLRPRSEASKVQNERIIAEAGVLLNDLVKFYVKNSFGGLEFLVGIPGSVGGAVRGNAGAWQKNIGDKIVKVKILDEKGKIKYLNRQDCQFSYRNSRFKKTSEVILEAEFLVEKKEKKEIKKIIIEYRNKRKNQPAEASAGSIFINPKPYSAGEMIERCGLKGRKIGGAQISPKHANFIVNLGGAKAKNVVALITLAKNKVKEKFGIDLREEIVRVGEF